MESDGDVESDTSSFEDLSAQEIPKEAPVESKQEKPVEEATNGEWMDVLGSGSLLKKILKEGDIKSEIRPQRTEICTIRLIGRLEDGSEFENYDKLQVQVGDLEVVQALDLVLPLMYINECSLVKVQPRLAYDSIGRDPDIPPNSVVIYEIELLQIVSEDDMDKIPILQRKKIG